MAAPDLIYCSWRPCLPRRRRPQAPKQVPATTGAYTGAGDTENASPASVIWYTGSGMSDTFELPAGNMSVKLAVATGLPLPLPR